MHTRIASSYLGVTLVKQEAPRGVDGFDGQLIGTQKEGRFHQIYRSQRGTKVQQQTNLISFNNNKQDEEIKAVQEKRKTVVPSERITKNYHKRAVKT